MNHLNLIIFDNRSCCESRKSRDPRLLSPPSGAPRHPLVRVTGRGRAAVVDDEKTGRAECDEWGIIDIGSVEAQCDVVAASIGSRGS